MKDTRSPVNGPLETGRDWVLGIAGLIVFGVVGYLLQGKLLSWPLLLALVAFISAVIRHRRRDRRGDG